MTEYMLTLRLPDRAAAQQWLEATFDLSVVSFQGIWDSPFRGELLAKISVTIPDEVKRPFEDGLNRIKNIYPEEKRTLVFWTEVD